MGNVMYAYITHSDTAPDINKPPTFDPMLGFSNGRKERAIEATREELDRANVPLDRRDYCVDFYLKFLRCRAENFPRVASGCHHEKHEYDQCEYEDFVMRMKEYEREKRMKERAKRIMEASEELED
ncbi:NADH dehydrogenase [ubiquinone] 1 beta subcomplex subunit 7-like [Babylonia areolata]|uniref:NADH dehydrogenase [ubiquinone] 1 beta subcomplex subunit 7-like n=1 Tax=Babylonia areolata TaxID=304850 RepID=UPI003FD5CC3C